MIILGLLKRGPCGLACLISVVVAGMDIVKLRQPFANGVVCPLPAINFSLKIPAAMTPPCFRAKTPVHVRPTERNQPGLRTSLSCRA